MAGMIHLDVARLDEKISVLSQIETVLEGGAGISSLPFGPGAAPGSRGLSSAQLEQLNRDFALCADKFSLLVAATVQYLQKLKTTFEQADARQGGGA